MFNVATAVLTNRLDSEVFWY